MTTRTESIQGLSAGAALIDQGCAGMLFVPGGTSVSLGTPREEDVLITTGPGLAWPGLRIFTPLRSVTRGVQLAF